MARHTKSATAIANSPCRNGPLRVPKLRLLMKAFTASGSARYSRPVMALKTTIDQSSGISGRRSQARRCSGDGCESPW